VTDDPSGKDLRAPRRSSPGGQVPHATLGRRALSADSSCPSPVAVRARADAHARRLAASADPQSEPAGRGHQRPEGHPSYP
jgi:hypothetical protein